MALISIDSHEVRKLQKSICGPKQASMNLNIHFEETIKEFGFHENEDKLCVNEKLSGSNIVSLILYVHDIL